MSENEEEYCVGNWNRIDKQWMSDIPDWVSEQLELVWLRVAGSHSYGDLQVTFEDGRIQSIQMRRG